MNQELLEQLLETHKLAVFSGEPGDFGDPEHPKYLKEAAEAVSKNPKLLKEAIKALLKDPEVVAEGIDSVTEAQKFLIVVTALGFQAADREEAMKPPLAASVSKPKKGPAQSDSGTPAQLDKPGPAQSETEGT